ncbi:retention module-containing protein [Vogesella sp. DC21W]|uniref:Retention module-containing protein n=2 Tax=Vogesella aquatica TaxID=2984206 RepID=A0ABT5ISQ9_9NEIS|nr:retention module-containing protein [Vogesella aquatica]
MANTANVQATVVALSGKILAVAADGTTRVLQLGDRVFSGERIVVPADAFIELRGMSGDIVRVVDERSINITDDVFSHASMDATDTAIAPLNHDARNVLAALENSQDPLQQLEATAAGLTGGPGEDGGSSFVRIARVAETIQTLSLSTRLVSDAATSVALADDAPLAPLVQDGTAPVLTVFLDPASDSGTVGDGITNDRTPTISGTGEPGNTVTVTSPSGEVLTTTVKPDGSWSVTPAQPLPDGAANFEVTATDPAGNTTSSSVPVTIDTTPPLASITLDANITADDVINASEAGQLVPVTGSVGADVKVGDTVTLTVNGKQFTGTVAADKTFSINVPGADLVADSDKTIDASVTTTDAAGNRTTATTTEGYRVDTTPPTVTARLDPASDSGTVGDGITNDRTPTISGTGEAGNTITVTSPTGETLTTTVKPDGTWSVTPAQPLPDGAANFEVTATDPAGNTASSSVPVTIDSAVPNAGAAPTVTISEDANNDGFINASEAKGPVDLKVAFDGSKVAIGDTVQITVNGVTQNVVISAADQANGYVSATTPLPAQDTMLDVSAVIVDAAGNHSAPGSDSAKVDRSDLGGVSISISEDANNDGVINLGELQGSVGVTITLPAGAIAGDLLTVSANGNATQAITLTPAQIAAGQVIVELQAPASGSTLTVSAQVTDAAGNPSNVATDSARIDTTAPTLSAQLDPASDSGTPGDGITNDNTPTISGTGEPGNTVSVTSPTGEVLTTTVKPDGSWSVTPAQPLPDGAANFEVTATDPAGNTASSSVPVTIDTTPPLASITLDANITADDVINASEAGQPVPVTGSVGADVKVGDTVTLTVNGKQFTGTVAADKTFSINVPGADLVADSDKTIDASVTTTDAAGNHTTVSDSEGYSLGTPPALTAQLDPASDSGAVGDGITNDRTPTISGTTTPGATVSVTSPTGEVLTTTAGADGKWSVTPTQPLPNGAANFPVTATSPAGDVSSTTVPVIIDTTAPTLSAQLDPASDSGTVGDGITNDRTPTISGTGEAGNTITVTSPTGETLTTTVKPDGTWSVTRACTEFCVNGHLAGNCYLVWRHNELEKSQRT